MESAIECAAVFSTSDIQFHRLLDECLRQSSFLSQWKSFPVHFRSKESALSARSSHRNNRERLPVAVSLSNQRCRTTATPKQYRLDDCLCGHPFASSAVYDRCELRSLCPRREYLSSQYQCSPSVQSGRARTSWLY